jgi:hypothetical protein
MLIGQVVNGGPKKLAKGAKITKEYLDDLDKYHWFDIRPADDAAPPRWKRSRNRSTRSVTSSTWPSKRSARS